MYTFNQIVRKFGSRVKVVNVCLSHGMLKWNFSSQEKIHPRAEINPTSDHNKIPPKTKISQAEFESMFPKNEKRPSSSSLEMKSDYKDENLLIYSPKVLSVLSTYTGLLYKSNLSVTNDLSGNNTLLQLLVTNILGLSVFSITVVPFLLNPSTQETMHLWNYYFPFIYQINSNFMITFGCAFFMSSIFFSRRLLKQFKLLKQPYINTIELLSYEKLPQI